MSKAHKITSLITFVCFLVLSFASAQQNSANASSNNGLSAQDRQFLEHMAKDSQGEVQLARMVQAKTNDPHVKEFTQRMIDDHTALDQQIRQVMSKHGMSMPAPMTVEQQQLQKKLQGLSGQQLDRAFMEAQVKGHEEDVQKVSPEAQRDSQLLPKDPAVAELAKEAKPVLQEHLQLARQVASQVGANTNAQSAEAR